MSNRSFDTFNIVPGNFCNFRCNHCVNDSGPNRKDRLHQTEVNQLVKELNDKQPQNILFTGGEPTLHIDLINEIIGRLVYQSFKVQITTNGWFAKSQEKMEQILCGFDQIDKVQLSFDTFHGSKLDTDDVRRLANTCENLNLKFDITMCISDPLEIIQADRLANDLNIRIVYQKVAAVGRARQSGVEFKQPRFDTSVLNQQCANLNTVSYIHGKGFTFCCGPLVFETNVPIAHATVDSHMYSEIRRKFETKTFGELLHDAGGIEGELTPAMSHPCVLCHHIQERGRCAKNS